MEKLLNIEVIPHPQKQGWLRLTITWQAADGCIISDESSHLFLQGVELALSRFRKKHDMI